MTTTDQRYGLSSGVAIKAPVRAATTANITLAAEQTVDGVALVDGDRCLVKDQSTGSQNGIYTVSTGNWSRSADFDGARDVVTSTRVWVTSGTVNANTEFVVTTTGTIVPGTTSIAFSSYQAIVAAAPSSADYLVKTASGSLSAERVVTDTSSVIWDWATAGQAKATVPAATETSSGIVELATSGEAATGTSTALAVTPAGVAAAIAAQSPALPRGYIDGLTISNSTADPTNDIIFAAGSCRNSSNTMNITVASALTKQIDAVWASGTGAGMRSASALSTGTFQSWHLFAIGGSTATADFLAHDDVDPTASLPNGYSVYRRVASIYRSSSVNTAVFQTGDRFRYVLAPPTDLAVAIATTAATTVTLSVPTGVVFDSDILASAVDATGGNGYFYISPIASSDSTPAANDHNNFTCPASLAGSASLRITTNSSRQIKARASTTAALVIRTYGYWDRRGADA